MIRYQDILIIVEVSQSELYIYTEYQQATLISPTGTVLSFAVLNDKLEPTQPDDFPAFFLRQDPRS